MQRSLPISLICLLCFWASGQADAVTGPEVIERMQKSFAKSNTFSAHFEKAFYWAVLDKHLKRSGRIFTSQPGRFRVELEDGDLIVADGQAMWAYNQQNAQVVVSDYDGELRTPWEILVEFAASFTPVSVSEAELSGRACYLVVLQPATEHHPGEGGTIVRMRVWVDRKRWYLLQVEQLESNGDLRTYVLTGHKHNKKIADDVFEFELRPDVDVVDRRNSAAQ